MALEHTGYIELPAHENAGNFDHAASASWMGNSSASFR